MTEFDPTQCGTGWASDHEDRAALHASAKAFAVPAPYIAPESISHRGWFRVQSQGNLGACVGFTLAEAAEICNWIDTGGQVVRCSAMWCYLRAQAHSGLLGSDNGATINGATQAGRGDGIPLADDFPYSGRYSTKIPDGVADKAKPHKILRHSVLRGYEQVFDWLSTGQGTVMIGVRWTRALSQAGPIIADAGAGGGGGHAVGLVGYSTRRDSDGRKYLELLNHWGTDWADRGWALVAPRVVDQWSHDAYSELVGVSDIQEFGFRTIPTWEGMTS